MKPYTLAVAWSALALIRTAAAQEKSPAPDPVDLAYQQLLVELEPRTGHPPDRAKQVELMREFLARHDRLAAHQRVLQLRTRLGTAYLHSCEFERARAQFAMVRANAPAEEQDLLGRACYGEAQALELLDDRKGARRILEEIVAVHTTLRYARFAKSALARLDPDGNIDARAGHVAPEFGPEAITDLDGRSHRLRTYRNRAVLLVFWSPAAPDSIKRLQSAVEAWVRGGGSNETVLALALAASTPQVEQARKAAKIEVPILSCNDEFVHPVALAYRVTKLPTVVMIAPSGAVVGRDFSPREIERLSASFR